MANEELKPCPFCGGEVSIRDDVPARLFTRNQGYCVVCNGCELLFGYDFNYGGDSETREQALTEWNKRI